MDLRVVFVVKLPSSEGVVEDSLQRAACDHHGHSWSVLTRFAITRTPVAVVTPYWLFAFVAEEKHRRSVLLFTSVRRSACTKGINYHQYRAADVINTSDSTIHGYPKFRRRDSRPWTVKKVFGAADLIGTIATRSGPVSILFTVSQTISDLPTTGWHRWTPNVTAMVRMLTDGH